jgi:hypothetical protein
MFASGTFPTKQDLLTDDLVIQMIDEAKAEAIKTIPVKQDAIVSDFMKMYQLLGSRQ